MNIISYSHIHKTRQYTYHFCNIKRYGDGSHAHTFYEYFFVMSGKAIHVYNGEGYILNRGDLFVIRPEDVHDFRPIGNEDCEWVNVAFSEKCIDQVFNFIEKDRGGIIDKDNSPLYIKLSEYNLKSFTKKHAQLNMPFRGDDEKRLYFKKLLLTVVELLVMQYEKSAYPDNHAQFFETLENINDIKVLREGVPALVRLSGFSHGHLCRLMKERLNTTLSQYVTDLRLTCASNLLLHSDLSVTDIAEKVGYFSLSHFMRLFKKRYGHTPYQFRKEHNVKY